MAASSTSSSPSRCARARGTTWYAPSMYGVSNLLSASNDGEKEVVEINDESSEEFLDKKNRPLPKDTISKMGLNETAIEDDGGQKVW